MLLAPLFLVSVAISVFAREVSEILFPAFDIDTVAVIIELLVIGVASNAIAQFAVNNLVASGYSHVPGVLQLCELPIFLVSLAVALKYFGLRGAAGIWSLRIVLDTAILLYWSRMRCASLTPPSWIYVHWSAVVVLSSLVFL
jgi:O-antigen/teichoic acid export membrane protein